MKLSCQVDKNQFNIFHEYFTLSSMYNDNNGQRTYINIGLAEKFLSV